MLIIISVLTGDHCGTHVIVRYIYYLNNRSFAWVNINEYIVLLRGSAKFLQIKDHNASRWKWQERVVLSSNLSLVQHSIGPLKLARVQDSASTYWLRGVRRSVTLKYEMNEASAKNKRNVQLQELIKTEFNPHKNIRISKNISSWLV